MTSTPAISSKTKLKILREITELGKNRRDVTKYVKLHYGESGLEFLSQLWADRCISVNAWYCVVWTKRGVILEQELRKQSRGEKR